MTNEEAVFCIFLMRFNIQPLEAMSIVNKWLNEHPTETWNTLKNLLREDQITLDRGKLKQVITQELSPQVNSTEPLKKYRGAVIQQESLEKVNHETAKKKFRYRGQEY